MQGQNRSRAAGKEKDVESFWTIIPLTAGYNRISSCKVINNSFRRGQDKTGTEQEGKRRLWKYIGRFYPSQSGQSLKSEGPHLAKQGEHQQVSWRIHLIKRSLVDKDEEEVTDEKKNTVIYEDVSLERGAFLVQQAMRAFRANNVESAKSRLSLCAQDIREQQEIAGNTSELCSQLGAVLGMLGDCCRAMGDAISAVAYFDESVTFLSKVETDHLEVTHTLSVSLNKIGDLKYYEGDLKSARYHYFRALDVRRNAINDSSKAPSQVLDVAVSLAKVADVDRNLDAEDSATEGFQEAIKLMECLKINSEENALEQRVCIVFT
ncbi:hypothetical protein LXL04_028706 [Taraxacum kok-saghyz]